MGFWLSPVPLARFEAFWSLVARCLHDGGRVFFADDAHRTPDELIAGEDSAVMRRRLNDGSVHRAIKVRHRAVDLEARLRGLGRRVTVTPTAGPFFFGSGDRAPVRPGLTDYKS